MSKIYTRILKGFCGTTQREREREGTMGCLLKFYNNVFLFVGLTTLGTICLVDLLSFIQTFQLLILNLYKG